jgi:hypothetical protein
VPEDIYSTIIKIRKIREKWEIQEIIASNLWPNETELVNFERNYGDALNDFDLYGIQGKKRMRKTRGKKKSDTDGSKIDKTAMSEQTSVYSMTNIRESYQRGEGETVQSIDNGTERGKANGSDVSKIDDSMR